MIANIIILCQHYFKRSNEFLINLKKKKEIIFKVDFLLKCMHRKYEFVIFLKTITIKYSIITRLREKYI